MNNWETVSQPNLDGLEYAHLEQKGDNDEYRLSGRDKRSGELIKILGSADEVEEQVGKRIINGNEYENLSLDEKVKLAVKELGEVFDIMMRKRTDYNENRGYPVSNSREGRKIINKLLESTSDEERESLFMTLQGEFEQLNRSLIFSSRRENGGEVYYINFRPKRFVINTETLKMRAKECAKNIVSYYEKKKKENAEPSYSPYADVMGVGKEYKVNLFDTEEGRKLIFDLTENDANPIIVFWDEIKQELANLGYDTLRPAPVYFDNPRDAGSYIHVFPTSSHVQQKKLA